VGENSVPILPLWLFGLQNGFKLLQQIKYRRAFTSPRPGFRTRLSRVEGNKPMRGVNESSSIQSLFREGSEKALQVRASLESVLRPFGESKMESRSLFVAFVSVRIGGDMVTWAEGRHSEAV
jgi:hypothetical protein